MSAQRQSYEQSRKAVRDAILECQKVIVGKTDLLETMLVSLLAEGHVLMEGVPGVAKTTIAKTFSRVLGLEYRRVQGSADILPADIVGTHVLDSKTGSFRLEKGPIFSNIFFADEINRNTPKANGAVLEAMQERQVTVEGETQALPRPFMVIATQSPIEFHGVFPLPEVLVDRFLISLKVDYPNAEEEIEITDRTYSIETAEIKQVLSKQQIIQLIELAREIHIAPQVLSYIVKVVQKTREAEGVSLGASPRASIALSRASRARALIKGRSYVLPDDIKHLAPTVLRHRMVPSDFTRSQVLTSETLVASLLEEIPVPPRLREGT